MESAEQKDATRWWQMTDNIDLLFTRVSEISRVQEKMHVNQELGVKAMEQELKDQAILSKQIEATSKAVAKLTLDRAGEEEFDAGSVNSLGSGPPFQFRQQRPPPQPPGGVPTNRSAYAPPPVYQEMSTQDIGMQCQSCPFQSFLDVIPRCGGIVAKISSSFTMFLNIYGLPQLQCTWRRVLVDGLKCRD